MVFVLNKSQNTSVMKVVTCKSRKQEWHEHITGLVDVQSREKFYYNISVCR